MKLTKHDIKQITVADKVPAEVETKKPRPTGKGGRLLARWEYDAAYREALMTGAQNKDVAERFGAHPASVRQHRRIISGRKEQPRAFNAEKKLLAERLALEHNWSCPMIAKRLGVDAQAVLKHIRREGIKPAIRQSGVRTVNYRELWAMRNAPEHVTLKAELLGVAVSNYNRNLNNLKAMTPGVREQHMKLDDDRRWLDTGGE